MPRAAKPITFRYSVTNANTNAEILRWACFVKCKRCRGRTKAGRRCSRRTCMYLPFCWQHLRSTMGLVVKPSQALQRKGIRGLGLYTRPNNARGTGGQSFVADQMIGEFKGRLLSGRGEMVRYWAGNKSFTAPYGIRTGTGRVRDEACRRSAMGYANGTRQLNVGRRRGQPVLRQNAQITMHPYWPRKVWLEATRNIPPNTEILVRYGREYWAGLKGVQFSTKR